MTRISGDIIDVMDGLNNAASVVAVLHLAMVGMSRHEAVAIGLQNVTQDVQEKIEKAVEALEGIKTRIVASEAPQAVAP